MRKFLLAAALAVIGLWGGAAHATCPTVNPNQFGPPFTDACPLPAAGLNILAQRLTVSPNLTVYVTPTGSATGLACLNSSTPCGGINGVANAMTEAATLIQSNQNILIDITGGGSYNGGVFSNAGFRTGFSPSSASRGQPYVEILGDGSPATLVENPSETSCAVCVVNFSSIWLNNIIVQKVTGAGSGFDVLVDGYSHVRLTNVTVDNNTNGVKTETMLDAASVGSLTMDGQITFEGATSLAYEAEDMAVVIFDDATTLTCGTNFSYSEAFAFANHGIINTQNTVTYSGCPTTGVALQTYENAAWKRDSLTDDMLVGDRYQINSSDTIQPFPYAPTLGTCANGTLRGGSTNYSFEIDYSGSGSSCIINFGKPASFTSYWASEPTCFVSGQVAATIARAITDVVVSGTFVTGNAIMINCQPYDGG